MIRLLQVVVTGLFTVFLAGCVHHTFAPGPGMSALDLDPDSARCRLFARGNRRDFDFSVYGSPKFVAGATAGAALGYIVSSAIEQNQNFEDCMQARGWRIADGQQTQSPYQGDPNARGVVGSPGAPSVLDGAGRYIGPYDGSSGEAPVITASATARVQRAEFLVRAVDVTPTLADSVHLGPPRGVLIQTVVAGGAAQKAGLLSGDVILDFNGRAIDGISDMQQALAAVSAGSTVIATVWRNSMARPIDVRF